MQIHILETRTLKRKKTLHSQRMYHARFQIFFHPAQTGQPVFFRNLSSLLIHPFLLVYSILFACCIIRRLTRSTKLVSTFYPAFSSNPSFLSCSPVLYIMKIFSTFTFILVWSFVMDWRVKKFQFMHRHRV